MKKKLYLCRGNFMSNLNYIIMKKLFTFFAALAMVTMSFAQLNESIVTNVQNNNMDRSDWFGFTANSSSAFIFDNAESEYLLRIPAGSIQTGINITKVIFEHFTNESFSGYTGDPFGAEEYIIKFYTGTTFVPTTYIGSDEQEDGGTFEKRRILL